MFAVGRRNGIIDIWSISDSLALRAKSVVSEPVIALGTCDNRLIAVGAATNIYVMDPFSIAKSCVKCHVKRENCACKGEEKADYFPMLQKIPHQSTISCASFSKIAPLIAIVSNSIPTLVDVRSGDVLWRAKSRKSSLLKLQRSTKINCICFLDAINQNVVAVGYGDGSIVIYDARIQKRPVFEFILGDKRSKGDKKEKFFKRLHEFDLSSRFPKIMSLDRDAPLRPIVTVNLIGKLPQISTIAECNYSDGCDIIVTDSVGNISRVAILTGSLLIKELKVTGEMDESKIWDTLIKARKLVKSAKTNDAPVAHAKSGPQFGAKVVSNYQPHRGAVVNVAVGDTEFVTASLDQTCAVYNVEANKMKQQIHLLEKQSLVLLV